MAPTREQIIEAIRAACAAREDVYALWLEGADGLGRVDPYSDLDIWVDAADAAVPAVLDACTAALSALAPVDFEERFEHPNHLIFQSTLHIEGTSPYLIIDLCVQCHSRGREGSTFVRGDVAEQALVLFDRAGVVTVIDPPPPDVDRLRSGLADARDRFAQRARVTKYLHRGKFPEAVTYYHRYVCEPVVMALRALHTPRHTEYGLVHISDHLPPEAVESVSALYAVASLQDIEARLPLADRVFAETMERLAATLGI